MLVVTDDKNNPINEGGYKRIKPDGGITQKLPSLLQAAVARHEKIYIKIKSEKVNIMDIFHTVHDSVKTFFSKSEILRKQKQVQFNLYQYKEGN